MLIFHNYRGRNDGLKWIDVAKIDQKKLQDINEQLEFE
jgi:hypothetical protein